MIVNGNWNAIVYISEGYSVMWPEPTVSRAIIRPLAPPTTQASLLEVFDDAGYGRVICAIPETKATSLGYVLVLSSADVANGRRPFGSARRTDQE